MPIQYTCARCGTQFSAYASWPRKYCSLRCYRNISAEERFWKKVQKSPEPDGCWIWIGARVHGYGHFGYGGKVVLAHRLSWLFAHPDLALPDDMQILHNCPGGDNPSCVNPAHLRPGTHLENMRDSATKGTHPRGARNFNTKLTEADVREIRARYAAGGVTMWQLGAEKGVQTPAIRSVLTRRTWKHLD